MGCHVLLQCMKVKSESEVAQSYPTLSDPMDCSLPGSSIHGIFQARVLEWGAIAFSAPNYTLNLNLCHKKLGPPTNCHATLNGAPDPRYGNITHLHNAMCHLESGHWTPQGASPQARQLSAHLSLQSRLAEPQSLTPQQGT